MTLPDIDKSPCKYKYFLLRLWFEDAESQSSQRILLINPKTGERRGFKCFEQMVDFLKEEQPGGSDPMPGEKEDLY